MYKMMAPCKIIKKISLSNYNKLKIRIQYKNMSIINKISEAINNSIKIIKFMKIMIKNNLTTKKGAES